VSGGGCLRGRELNLDAKGNNAISGSSIFMPEGPPTFEWVGESGISLGMMEEVAVVDAILGWGELGRGVVGLGPIDSDEVPLGAEGASVLVGNKK
jgi:hypothetical protein